MLTSLIYLAALQVAPVAVPAPPLPPPCEAEAFAAFDFWVGEWDVFPTGTEVVIAQSRIEKLYGGCAIRESWMPLRGAGGGSLSAYDPKTGRWHQSWVGGGGPGTVYFDGGMAGNSMVLTGWWPGSGPKGEDGLTRMTYSPLDGGAVRQHGEFSADQGVTWTTSFDFTYRPKEASQ